MSGRQPKLGLFALLACLGVTWASALSFAQEDTVPDKPTLKVRMTPTTPYLQEEILQVIRVVSPHPFEELVLDLPPVEGAVTITLQQPKNRKFETYGGEGFIYETSRAIFPKQSGELRVPPVRISGSVGVSRNEKKPFVLREDAAILDVRPSPDAFSEDWWLVASDVAIVEAWSQPLDTVRVGDRVTRSIVVTVTGATGAHLPELEQGRSNGLTVLPGRTERKSEVTPGGVIGTVSRSFDIRVDVDQPINISPVRVVWWNTDTESEHRSAAPAVRLEPLPRDVEALVSEVMAKAAEARKTGQRGIVAVSLGVGALIATLVVLLLRAKRNVKPEDRMLERALAMNRSPINTLRALSTWAETTFPNRPPITLEQVGRKLGPEAEQHVARIQEAAFGHPSDQIETTGIALEIMRLAQASRRQMQKGMLRDTITKVLGPEKRLPEINRTPF